MANRRCALPNIEDLSKDQERARLLPREGRHLIVGGPGTGKSVIALLRSRRYHRASGGQDYVFLVFNRLLLEASRELVGGAVNAHLWKSWLKLVYRSALSEPCPVIDGCAYRLDWHGIKERIAAAGEIPAPVTPFLIVDEGQDMPPAFYQALAELGFEHFFVVADQNQQITDEHSTIREIENALDIATAERIELRENYRNAYPVARLAREFCVKDPASPCVELPPEQPAAVAPVLVEYGPGCQWDFPEVISRILKAADRDPARLIGIIAPNNETRRRWFDALRRQPVELDHERPRILTYASGEEQGDHRFCEGGIFVINAQSAKGLEFDWVFLADIDRYPCRADDVARMDDLKRRCYVMISRARERVFLLRQAGRPCPIETLLPTNQTILRRWR